jgi:hypothetical protein
MSGATTVGVSFGAIVLKKSASIFMYKYYIEISNEIGIIRSMVLGF